MLTLAWAAQSSGFLSPFMPKLERVPQPCWVHLLMRALTHACPSVGGTELRLLVSPHAEARARAATLLDAGHTADVARHDLAETEQAFSPELSPR